MQAVKTFFANNWLTITGVAVLALVLYFIYRAGKTAGGGNYQVVNDQGQLVNPTAQQKQQATNIAQRIYADLNSGWLGGYNLWGSIMRDTEAYETFANMSDTLFAFTAQTYRTQYNRSIIADIRDESSLPTGAIGTGSTPKDQILAKAQRLNIN